MAPLITGIEDWILGIVVALGGFAIPQLITLEHPIKWKLVSIVVSGVFVTIGIGIILVTK